MSNFLYINKDFECYVKGDSTFVYAFMKAVKAQGIAEVVLNEEQQTISANYYLNALYILDMIATMKKLCPDFKVVFCNVTDIIMSKEFPDKEYLDFIEFNHDIILSYIVHANTKRGAKALRFCFNNDMIEDVLTFSYKDFQVSSVEYSEIYDSFAGLASHKDDVTKEVAFVGKDVEDLKQAFHGAVDTYTQT
jgi:hypothetical protein